MLKNVFLFFTVVLFLKTTAIIAQSGSDINTKNSQKEQISRSNIKSKSLWEYHYTAGGAEEVLSDSGYKAYFYGFDKAGRMTDYTKYHIFSDLTVREVYRYGKTDNIEQTARYNSAGDMIELIDYKYNSTGRLKKEVHTAYYNTIRPGIYFSILANVSDGELFSKLQDDLEIDPKLESYTININITDPIEENQYIVIGDESDPTSPRYSWSQLTMENQRGLLSYQGPNRKEHTYISKNIANINYKYDTKGNLLQRTVFNTANDQLEKENYTYNGNNLKTNYYRYNESGKIGSMETYTYDPNGKLTETVGLDPSGKVVSRLAYKYDDAGNLAEKSWLSPSGETNGKYLYKYDNSSNVTEETKLRGEGEKESKNVYKYDPNYNITEIVKYDVSDKKEKLMKYIYEFY